MDIKCTACSKLKPVSGFKFRSDSGTYRKQCIVCLTIKRKEDYTKNKARDLQRSKEYYSDNVDNYKDKRAEYYIDNKEIILARNNNWKEVNKEQHAEKCAEYAKANRGKRNAWDAEYTASKAQRTPPWFEKELVEAIYIEADEFRKTGLAIDVDHIVPLRGKLVSGLHCIANLQILEEGLNRSKNNNFVV